MVNASTYPTLAAAANQAAKNGWRTIGIDHRAPGHDTHLLVEREMEPPMIIIQNFQNDEPKRRQWWNPKSW